MSPNEEIIQIIRLSPEPISAADIYEQCKSIETISDVSSRLSQLFNRSLVYRKQIMTPNNRKGFLYTLKKEKADIGLLSPEQSDLGAAQPAPTAEDPPVIDIPTLMATPKPDKPAKPAKPIKPTVVAKVAKVAKGLDRVEKTRQDVAYEASLESLADAILARSGEQIKGQIGMSESLFSETAAAGIHITVNIEQVDVHLGGL